jgi:hypothetical protein
MVCGKLVFAPETAVFPLATVIAPTVILFDIPLENQFKKFNEFLLYKSKVTVPKTVFQVTCPHAKTH